MIPFEIVTLLAAYFAAGVVLVGGTVRYMDRILGRPEDKE